MAKNPAEVMIKNKRKLIARLEREIKQAWADAETEVAKIKRRIQVAQVLLSALEKGTLKP